MPGIRTFRRGRDPWAAFRLAPELPTATLDQPFRLESRVPENFSCRSRAHPRTVRSGVARPRESLGAVLLRYGLPQEPQRLRADAAVAASRSEVRPREFLGLAGLGDSRLGRAASRGSNRRTSSRVSPTSRLSLRRSVASPHITPCVRATARPRRSPLPASRPPATARIRGAPPTAPRRPTPAESPVCCS